MKFRNADSVDLATRLTRLTQQFGNIASMTINALTGSNFTVRDVTFSSDGVHTDKKLLFTIGFTGTVFGEFIFAMEPATLKSIVMNNGDDDMLGEILNVVSGQLLNELSKNYKRLTMTSPRVIRGQIQYPQARSAKALLRGAHGDIECHIFLDHMQLELASAYDNAINTLNELLELGDQIVRKSAPHITAPVKIEAEAEAADGEEDDDTESSTIVELADITKKIG